MHSLCMEWYITILLTISILFNSIFVLCKFCILFKHDVGNARMTYETVQCAVYNPDTMFGILYPTMQCVQLDQQFSVQID